MAESQIERAGIYKDEVTGELFIPASRRPDGTWRKPRKVKDGYIPPEEVPTYENKGVQWMKSKPSLPPGLDPVSVPTKQKEENVVLSKAAKKNLKRKEKKKQQPQEQSITTDQLTNSLAKTNLKSDQSNLTSANGDQPSESDRAGIEKKIRNLKKKLKQIEDLEAKINSGELKEPQKEQLEKVAKKSTLLAEIEDLELELID